MAPPSNSWKPPPSGCLSSLPVGAPRALRFAGSRDRYLARIGPSTVVSVPLAPAICVEVGEAGVVPLATAELVGEPEVWPAVPLVAWVHPAPMSVTIAIAAENAVVRFVVARIAFLLSNRTEPSTYMPSG